MSLTSDAVDETSRAWTDGKSPLPFQVRRFIGRTGREVLILIDRGRGPAFYPTLFMTCLYDKKRYPANTRMAVLRALGMARAWAAARRRDLDHDLRLGPFLSLDDAEVLADHLMLSVEEQVVANTVAAQEARRTRRSASKLEQFRPHPKALATAPAGLASASAFPRILWVALYVKWHYEQRLDVSDRSATACPDLRVLGPQIVARLKERGSGDGSTSIDDESLEGVSQEEIDLVSDALRPGDPRNPFTTGFNQARNELLWHFFISSGGRRSEVLSVRVKHVSFSQRRMFISQSKTQTRWVKISRAAAEMFEFFIHNRWSKLPQAARREGLLFTSAKGEPLGVRQVNRIFVTIRTRVPGCPKFLVPHTTRRTFSDVLCDMLDSLPPDKKISEKEEIRLHNKMQGWAEKSPMAARYAARHVRRKADELGEQLANTIGKSPRRPGND
jgi:integrase